MNANRQEIRLVTGNMAERSAVLHTTNHALNYRLSKLYPHIHRSYIPLGTVNELSEVI